jgi:hypothetical protein
MARGFLFDDEGAAILAANLAQPKVQRAPVTLL